jgi:beta-glucosidase
MIVVPVQGSFLTSLPALVSSGWAAEQPYACAEPTDLQELIQTVGVGGVWINAAPAAEAYLRIQQLQSWASLPLLVGSSLEQGSGHLFSGLSRCFPALTLQGLEADQRSYWAASMARMTAREALTLGINWLLAPVVDPLPQTLNPFLADHRTFGSDPQQVSLQVNAFIAAARAEGMLTTAKTYPGYSWSRSGEDRPWPRSELPLQDLMSGPLQPLLQAVQVGVDAVMTAHVLLPDTDPEWLATFSPAVLQPLLSSFGGLVITDVLDHPLLLSHLSPAEMALRAVQAGADLLLAPPRPAETVAALCEAVDQGVISVERIQRSVGKILRAKQRVMPQAASLLQHWWPSLRPPSPPSPSSLDSGRRVETGLLRELLLDESLPKGTARNAMGLGPLTALSHPAESQETQTYLQSLTHASMQGQHLEDLPLRPQGLAWIWTKDGLRSQDLEPESPAITYPMQAGLELLISDNRTPLTTLESTLTAAEALIVQWFLPTTSSLEEPPPWLWHLLAEHVHKTKAVIWYGNRHLGQRLSAVLQEAPHPIPYLQSHTAHALVQNQIWARLLGTSGSSPI